MFIPSAILVMGPYKCNLGDKVSSLSLSNPLPVGQA